MDKPFHPHPEYMGPGCLKRAEEKKGGPAVTSGLGDLAVKTLSRKGGGQRARRALPKLRGRIKLFKNTRKYAQCGTDLNLMLMRFGFPAL